MKTLKLFLALAFPFALMAQQQLLMSGNATMFGLPYTSGGCIAPSIDSGPTPSLITCITNTTTNFTVTASGTATLYYQWRSNSVAIGNDSTYAGATTATLWLSNVTTAMPTNYTVVITNACGSVTSSVANLTVTNGASETLWYSQSLGPITVNNAYRFQGIHNTSSSPLNIVKVKIYASGGGTPQSAKVQLWNWAQSTQYGSDSDTQVIPASGDWVVFNFSPAVTVPANTDFYVRHYETAGTVYWSADNSIDYSPYDWDGNAFRSLTMEIWIQ